MSDELLKLLLNMDSASALMALVFGITGLLWMLIFSLFCGDRVSSTKLIGSGLVLGMAFAANHVVTYGLSIFIVATLVTELHFLEKIAALFWDRDKYWEHLQKQSPAAIAEKAEKEAQEIQQSPSEEDKPAMDVVRAAATVSGPVGAAVYGATSSLAQKLMQTEDRVLDGLVLAGGPFEGGELLKNYAVRYGATYAEFDAIIRFSDTHYVIELKQGDSIRNANFAIRQIRDRVPAYTKVLHRQNIDVSVRPVVILPKTINKKAVDPMGALLYTFDPNDYSVKPWSD